MRAQAIDGLLRCGAVTRRVTGLAAALANWLSGTTAGRMIVPARLALSDLVGFVDESGRTAAK